MRLLRMFLSFSVWTAALISLSLCLNKYLSRELGTRVSLLSPNFTPAFTICWRFGYNPNVLRKLNIPLDINALLAQHFPPENVDFKDFLKETRMELEHFLMAVNVTTRAAIEDEYSTQLWSNDNNSFNMIKFDRVGDKVHNLCFSSSIPNEVILAGVSSILFYFKDLANVTFRTMSTLDRGWAVRLHHEGQSRRFFADIDASQSIESHYDLSYRLHRRLGDCSLAMDKGYDKCFESGVRKLSMERHGCFAPWHAQNIEEEVNICENKSFYEDQQIDEDIQTEIRDRANKDTCPEPCEMMRVSASVKEQQRLRRGGLILRLESKLVLHFPLVVKVADEFLVYDMLSMVGEAGGYLGIFTGVSAIILVDAALKRSKKQKRKREMTVDIEAKERY